MNMRSMGIGASTKVLPSGLPMSIFSAIPGGARGHETYGEDPYLTGRMGVAFVKGDSGGGSKYLKAAACAKHYAVHSGPEALRARI